MSQVGNETAVPLALSMIAKAREQIAKHGGPDHQQILLKEAGLLEIPSGEAIRAELQELNASPAKKLEMIEKAADSLSDNELRTCYEKIERTFAKNYPWENLDLFNPESELLAIEAYGKTNIPILHQPRGSVYDQAMIILTLSTIPPADHISENATKFAKNVDKFKAAVLEAALIKKSLAPAAKHIGELVKAAIKEQQ